jgi:hypothetical protein
MPGARSLRAGSFGLAVVAFVADGRAAEPPDLSPLAPASPVAVEPVKPPPPPEEPLTPPLPPPAPSPEHEPEAGPARNELVRATDGEATIDAMTASAPTPYLFEAAGRSGYASAPIRGGVNPFGAGFGARAGFTFGGFYVGGSVMDFLGGSDGSASDTALLFGLDVGWNARIGQYLTLRPRLGLGDAILTHTEPRAGGVDVVTTASGSSSFGGGTVATQVKNVYVEPGFTLLVGYGRFFLGGDVGAFVVPGILYGPAPAQQTTWLSYSLTAQLGFRL